MHVFEGIQEIDDHYSQYCNTYNMIPVTIERLYESHQRCEETVEEACDYRSESDARKEARIPCYMHGKRCVIPVVNAADLLDWESEEDLAYWDNKETRTEEKPYFFFLRYTQKKINDQYRHSVSYKERKIHITIIDLSLTEEHPDILKAKTQEWHYDHQSDVVIYRIFRMN